MPYGTAANEYSERAETRVEGPFVATPFGDPTAREHEEPIHEAANSETVSTSWEFTTPFLPGESSDTGESVAATAEVSAFSEMTAELKDPLFREALEELAEEAMEAHAAQLSGEYGDRETREENAERILGDHFAPVYAEMEAMLDRFCEHLQGYEAESLTDTEIERISNEVLPTTQMSPAQEQFLGGFLRKAGKLVSGAVNLAKKGIAGAVKLAGKALVGPLLAPLKLLGKFLLQHVIKFAMGQLPPSVRPLAQKLSDKLFHAIGETHEGEIEGHEQMESEALAATPDAANLEAEFDVHVAQLMLAGDETDIDHLVSSYGESENYSSALNELDDARSQFVKQLSELQPGENPQPVMEQFLPAFVWPAAKTAITVFGRPKLVSFIARLLSGLVKPLIGADGAALLAPAIADAGLRIFGLEAEDAEPRTLAAEALAATIEETMNSISELPPHILENETLLSDAVREAFETAASSYFPNSVIKPELRESSEHHGMWKQMPAYSERKRYAKYSDSQAVEIPPRLAATIKTFGNNTLYDHLRDHHGHHDGRPFQGKVTLYQALPGARSSTIARAEGFPASQLHPLTPQAAGALLGKNASLGTRNTPAQYLDSREKLHVNQRLYRLEPGDGRFRRHHHTRPLHSEMLINLQRGEIRLWLYLSEPLCQRIAADLAKAHNESTAFATIKPLLARTAQALEMAAIRDHLPRWIHIVSDKPNLNHQTPPWLRHIGRHLAAKIREWAQIQLVQYLRNNAEEFKRACASHHDGVTLRITMTRIPGVEALRQVSQGKSAPDLLHGSWPKGFPSFHVTQHAGYSIHKLRT